LARESEKYFVFSVNSSQKSPKRLSFVLELKAYYFVKKEKGEKNV